MSKRVVIVGAGIAGLTAGIHAQRSGFDTTIVEQHTIPGGMCTSWRRKGYLFEGGMHWLTGSSPKTAVFQMWKDIGAIDEETPMLLGDPFRSMEWEGQVIHVFRDIDKTAEQLLALSPADEKPIRQLVKDTKVLCRMQMPVIDIKGVKVEKPRRMGLGSLFNMLPALPTVARLSRISCLEWTRQFAHPGIQQLFRILQDEYAASSLLFTLATLHAGDGGYPEGGSLAFAQRMAETFTGLGGKLLYGTPVQKVDVRDGKACGVVLEGATLEADAVIVTQDAAAALGRLFDTPPQDAWLAELRETVNPAVCTFVSIGVRTPLPDGLLPEWELEEPITYADQAINRISFNSYRRYAPEGATALTTALLADTYDFWEKARAEGRYEAEKQALADQFSRALCAKYPQCVGNIEVIDIATPLTYERYTSAFHGSWMTITPPRDKMKRYLGACESVDGLFFAGQRLMPPGGLPSAAASGRQTAQLVCRRFDAVFK
ncbi:MAG: NAD(P)/FAD-dependent oxidoreductase [Eggerthellaceae bacterium]|nr:NAD(P)/FAD-dependent oxidoreductase [Eggerthellaceae bacterium]